MKETSLVLSANWKEKSKSQKNCVFIISRYRVYFYKLLLKAAAFIYRHFNFICSYNRYRI